MFWQEQGDLGKSDQDDDAYNHRKNKRPNTFEYT